MLVRHLKYYNENVLLREFSNQITKKHLANLPYLKHRLTKSEDIYNLFLRAFYLSPNTFEKLKTILSSEELDLLDLPDLLDDLHPAVSLKLRHLFLINYNLSDSFLYHTQAITDLDCTFVENRGAGRVVYNDKEVVFGIAPLHRALTREGSTCLTVVSARPKFMETHSLYSNRKRLKDAGIHHYSFESGEIDGTILFLSSQALRNGGNFVKANELLLKSATSFADLKFKCYLRLKGAFPLSNFVFTGDDTQGDFIFAVKLVSDNPKNFAIIRKIAKPGEDVSPFSRSLKFPSNPPITRNVCSRIIYVESFYEAICRAPSDVLPFVLRKRAASLALEEYYRRYVTSFSRFESPIEARRRDSKWLEDLFVISHLQTSY